MSSARSSPDGIQDNNGLKLKIKFTKSQGFVSDFSRDAETEMYSHDQEHFIPFLKGSDVLTAKHSLTHLKPLPVYMGDNHEFSSSNNLSLVNSSKFNVINSEPEPVDQSLHHGPQNQNAGQDLHSCLATVKQHPLNLHVACNFPETIGSLIKDTSNGPQIRQQSRVFEKHLSDNICGQLQSCGGEVVEHCYDAPESRKEGFIVNSGNMEGFEFLSFQQDESDKQDEACNSHVERNAQQCKNGDTVKSSAQIFSALVNRIVEDVYKEKDDVQSSDEDSITHFDINCNLGLADEDFTFSTSNRVAVNVKSNPKQNHLSPQKVDQTSDLIDQHIKQSSGVESLPVVQNSGKTACNKMNCDSTVNDTQLVHGSEHAETGTHHRHVDEAELMKRATVIDCRSPSGGTHDNEINNNARLSQFSGSNSLSNNTPGASSLSNDVSVSNIEKVPSRPHPLILNPQTGSNMPAEEKEQQHSFIHKTPAGCFSSDMLNPQLSDASSQQNLQTLRQDAASDRKHVSSSLKTDRLSSPVSVSGQKGLPPSQPSVSQPLQEMNNEYGRIKSTMLASLLADKGTPSNVLITRWIPVNRPSPSTSTQHESQAEMTYSSASNLRSSEKDTLPPFPRLHCSTQKKTSSLVPLFVGSANDISNCAPHHATNVNVYELNTTSTDSVPLHLNQSSESADTVMKYTVDLKKPDAAFEPAQEKERTPTSPDTETMALANRLLHIKKMTVSDTNENSEMSQIRCRCVTPQLSNSSKDYYGSSANMAHSSEICMKCSKKLSDRRERRRFKTREQWVTKSRWWCRCPVPDPMISGSSISLSLVCLKCQKNVSKKWMKRIGHKLCWCNKPILRTIQADVNGIPLTNCFDPYTCGRCQRFVKKSSDGEKIVISSYANILPGLEKSFPAQDLHPAIMDHSYCQPTCSTNSESQGLLPTSNSPVTSQTEHLSVSNQNHDPVTSIQNASSASAFSFVCPPQSRIREHSQSSSSINCLGTETNVEQNREMNQRNIASSSSFTSTISRSEEDPQTLVEMRMNNRYESSPDGLFFDDASMGLLSSECSSDTCSISLPQNAGEKTCGISDTPNPIVCEETNTSVFYQGSGSFRLEPCFVVMEEIDSKFVHKENANTTFPCHVSCRQQHLYSLCKLGKLHQCRHSVKCKESFSEEDANQFSVWKRNRNLFSPKSIYFSENDKGEQKKIKNVKKLLSTNSLRISNCVSLADVYKEQNKHSEKRSAGEIPDNGNSSAFLPLLPVCKSGTTDFCISPGDSHPRIQQMSGRSSLHNHTGCSVIDASRADESMGGNASRPAPIVLSYNAPGMSSLSDNTKMLQLPGRSLLHNHSGSSVIGRVELEDKSMNKHSDTPAVVSHESAAKIEAPRTNKTSDFSPQSTDSWSTVSTFNVKYYVFQCGSRAFIVPFIQGKQTRSKESPTQLDEEDMGYVKANLRRLLIEKESCARHLKYPDCLQHKGSSRTVNQSTNVEKGQHAKKAFVAPTLGAQTLDIDELTSLISDRDFTRLVPRNAKISKSKYLQEIGEKVHMYLTGGTEETPEWIKDVARRIVMKQRVHVKNRRRLKPSKDISIEIDYAEECIDVGIEATKTRQTCAVDDACPVVGNILPVSSQDVNQTNDSHQGHLAEPHNMSQTGSYVVKDAFAEEERKPLLSEMTGSGQFVNLETSGNNVIAGQQIMISLPQNYNHALDHIETAQNHPLMRPVEDATPKQLFSEFPQDQEEPERKPLLGELLLAASQSVPDNQGNGVNPHFQQCQQELEQQGNSFDPPHSEQEVSTWSYAVVKEEPPEEDFSHAWSDHAQNDRTTSFEQQQAGSSHLIPFVSNATFGGRTVHLGDDNGDTVPSLDQPSGNVFSLNAQQSIKMEAVDTESSHSVSVPLITHTTSGATITVQGLPDQHENTVTKAENMTVTLDEENPSQSQVLTPVTSVSHQEAIRPTINDDNETVVFEEGAQIAGVQVCDGKTMTVFVAPDCFDQEKIGERDIFDGLSMNDKNASKDLAYRNDLPQVIPETGDLVQYGDEVDQDIDSVGVPKISAVAFGEAAVMWERAANEQLQEPDEGNQTPDYCAVTSESYSTSQFNVSVDCHRANKTSLSQEDHETTLNHEYQCEASQQFQEGSFEDDFEENLDDFDDGDEGTVNDDSKVMFDCEQSQHVVVPLILPNTNPQVSVFSGDCASVVSCLQAKIKQESPEDLEMSSVPVIPTVTLSTDNKMCSDQLNDVNQATQNLSSWQDIQEKPLAPLVPLPVAGDEDHHTLPVDISQSSQDLLVHPVQAASQASSSGLETNVATHASQELKSLEVPLSSVKPASVCDETAQCIHDSSSAVVNSREQTENGGHGDLISGKDLTSCNVALSAMATRMESELCESAKIPAIAELNGLSVSAVQSIQSKSKVKLKKRRRVGKGKTKRRKRSSRSSTALPETALSRQKTDTESVHKNRVFIAVSDDPSVPLKTDPTSVYKNRVYSAVSNISSVPLLPLSSKAEACDVSANKEIPVPHNDGKVDREVSASEKLALLTRFTLTYKGLTSLKNDVASRDESGGLPAAQSTVRDEVEHSTYTGKCTPVADNVVPPQDDNMGQDSGTASQGMRCLDKGLSDTNGGSHDREPQGEDIPVTAGKECVSDKTEQVIDVSSLIVENNSLRETESAAVKKPTTSHNLSYGKDLTCTRSAETAEARNDRPTAENDVLTKSCSKDSTDTVSNLHGKEQRALEQNVIDHQQENVVSMDRPTCESAIPVLEMGKNCKVVDESIEKKNSPKAPDEETTACVKLYIKSKTVSKRKRKGGSKSRKKAKKFITPVTSISIVHNCLPYENEVQDTQKALQAPRKSCSELLLSSSLETTESGPRVTRAASRCARSQSHFADVSHREHNQGISRAETIAVNESAPLHSREHGKRSETTSGTSKSNVDGIDTFSTVSTADTDSVDAFDKESKLRQNDVVCRSDAGILQQLEKDYATLPQLSQSTGGPAWKKENVQATEPQTSQVIDSTEEGAIWVPKNTKHKQSTGLQIILRKVKPSSVPVHSSSKDQAGSAQRKKADEWWTSDIRCVKVENCQTPQKKLKKDIDATLSFPPINSNSADTRKRKWEADDQKVNRENNTNSRDGKVARTGRSIFSDISSVLGSAVPEHVLPASCPPPSLSAGPQSAPSGAGVKGLNTITAKALKDGQTSLGKGMFSRLKASLSNIKTGVVAVAKDCGEKTVTPAAEEDSGPSQAARERSFFDCLPQGFMNAWTK